MRPLADLPAQEAKGLSGLLFDLDDTFLDRGRLHEHAYASLFRMREAGLSLIAVTGRPSGWAEVIVRQWPLDGAVTENGALLVYRTGDMLKRWDRADESERSGRRRRIAFIVAEVQRAFPMLRAADDVSARVSDFTFDIGEHERVPRAKVDEVDAFIRERGARTLRSSVHLHVTLDGDDKASGSLRLLHMLFGVDPTEARFGDSENDSACFAAFASTLGVQNLSGRPSVPPRYITPSPRSKGFLEAAQTLLERRGVGAPRGVR
jgi:hypothetical protein